MQRDLITFQMLSPLKDLQQQIFLVLATLQGTDPLRPDYGTLLPTYIGEPINQVRLKIVREVFIAIQRYVVDYVVKACRVEIDNANPGHFILAINGQFQGAENTINVNI